MEKLLNMHSAWIACQYLTHKGGLRLQDTSTFLLEEGQFSLIVPQATSMYRQKHFWRLLHEAFYMVEDGAKPTA